MSRKKLNTTSMLNELTGKSRFFEPPLQDKPVKPIEKVEENELSPDTITPSKHDTVIPRNHDTKVSRYHKDTIEEVRKAVKTIGKEPATHRFTIEEKQRIGDIVYAYKRLGIRTSENEIARIAINFVIKDHTENGKTNILDAVLKALNE